MALKFVAASTGLVLALAAIGFVPTRRIAGPEGLPAMLAGCGASLLGAWCGVVPLALAGGSDPRRRFEAVAIGTMVRFAVTLSGALGLALLTTLPRGPLLIWVAVSYVGLLSLETLVAVRLSRGASKTD